MDQLLAMRTFVRVAERGSFSAVAREMESTQSQISRHVANLEQRLGAALLTRTTRQVQLTTEGRMYLEFARRALSECDEGEALLRDGRQSLSGLLRISTAGGLFRQVLFKPLQDLMAANPGLQLDVQINDAFVDLVSEGIDLAIRGGELSDSSLIARKLTELERIVCASPAYLQRESATRPPIIHPSALEQHECLAFSNWRDPRWQFEDEQGQSYDVSVGGRWRFNQVLAVRDAVMAGLGVGLVTRMWVQDALDKGVLVHLLPGFRCKPLPVYAVYPASRRQVARVEAVVQTLLAHLQPDQAS